MCAALGVSKSGYHDWLDRPENTRRIENKRLVKKIRVSHRQSRGIYGSPKVHRDLISEGEVCSVNRVARLMRKENIQSKVARKFIVTTNSKNTLKAAPDLLKQRFKVESKNEAWVSDTTFIETREGWLYLATIIDLYSRQIIGWSMSDRNNTKLVSDALTMAIWRRGKVKDVIVHSDQGSTYASKDYQNELIDNNLRPSMSRKGECLDNAVAESFFGSLKNEWIYHTEYRSREEARKSVFEYIEIFYNRQRRHQFLDFMTPAEFEAKSG